MRNSVVGKWEAFKVIHEAREAEALGIDVQHYFEAILGWSNKNNRKRRTAHGWVDTVKGAMRRDKDQGRLRMINAATEDAEDTMRYLKMGRE